jgi:hypothetical protein
VAGILAGLVLVVGTLATGVIRSAPAGQRLLDLARPVFTNAGLSAQRQDFNDLQAVGTEVGTVIVPAYARAAGINPGQFASVLNARYPAFAKATVEAPSTAAFANKAITNLEAHRSDFAPADSMPTSSLPLVAAPIITLGLGVALIVVGALALRTRVQRGLVVTILLLGVALLGFTLGTRTFHKVAATHDLLASLNLTKAGAVETRQRLVVQEAGAAELQTRVLPDLQAKLGLSDPQFAAFLQDRAPHLAGLRGDLVGAVDHFAVDANVRERGFKDFQRVKRVPLRLLPWLYVIAGALAILGGAVTLFAWRGEPLTTETNTEPVVGATASA